MIRGKRVWFVAMVLLAVVSCSRERATITGGYGDRMLSGQVVMEGTAIGTPAGVEVSVPGTGMRTVLREDGQFAFSGVPDGTELHFSRAADGVEASMRTESGATHVVVSLAQTTATQSSRRRGVGRGGEKIYEFEGLIRSVSADQLVVFTSKREEVTIGLGADTVIRKGNQVVSAADLVVGGRVHVKARKSGDAYTAVLVIVQSKDDDDDEQPAVREYEGVVKSASATELVIFDSHRAEVPFTLNDATDIRKGNTPVKPADIQVGWRVHVKATVASDGAKTAVRVIIQDDRDEEDTPKTAEYEGVVVSASATSLVLDVAEGPDVTFVLNAATVVRKQGTIGTAADLAAGQRVEVRAGLASDGTKTALRVTIEDDRDEEETAEYEGVVVSASATSLVLDVDHGPDVTFVLNAATVVRKRGTNGTVADLAAGQRVEVRASLASDGTKTALRVTIEND